mmetsp:Transcript_144344/g.350468  ORF Transcript_144344/g.350468 Transcript_144344/m.350468 type:complete len:273 (+) Transcript_144344:105-923(+)
MWQQQQQPHYQAGMPMQQMQQYPDNMVVQGTPVGMVDGKMPVCQTPPHVRSDFIRKVYTLLTMQLFVTFGIALYMNTQLTPYFVFQNRGIFYMASFGTMAFMIGVSCCCAGMLRTFPFNYAFLAIVTLGMSVMVGFTTVLYTTESVLLALGATAGVFLLLTAYACLTKTDFTGIGPYLFAGLLCLSLFSFGMMLFSWFTGSSLMGSAIHKAYACAGVLLFVFYIIYDTQLIVGGQHKSHQHSVDDYVLATIDLYLDIINLFMFLLEMMGDRR